MTTAYFKCRRCGFVKTEQMVEPLFEMSAIRLHICNPDKEEIGVFEFIGYDDPPVIAASGD